MPDEAGPALAAGMLAEAWPMLLRARLELDDRGQAGARPLGMASLVSLMRLEGPKIRLAQNHCPLHSPFRSESSPHTQGVEFFVVQQQHLGAHHLGDSFNQLRSIRSSARSDAAPPFVVSRPGSRIEGAVCSDFWRHAAIFIYSSLHNFTNFKHTADDSTRDSRSAAPTSSAPRHTP